MTTNPWEHAARAFEPAPPPRFPTPGHLAAHITPTTINTPALTLVDQALTKAWNTPDARLIISMAPQEGKALALDTPIATPTGWTTMGDIRVGDQVFDRHGKPCNVTWVSPVWHDRPCYTVHTGDGETIVADAAHEWPARLDRRRSERLVETALLSHPRSKNAQITAVASLDTPTADLPLDPYVFGAWLGDGNSDGPIVTCHPDDIAIRDRFAEAGWPLKHCGHYGWSMVPEGWTNRGGRYPSPAKAVLKSLGVLGNKHIPVAYLRASHEQRLALLQGLIDTDGHVTLKGQVEFVSTNRRLAEQVRELVFTLGAKATLTTGRATINGRDCGPKYRVRFYLANAAHLPRKANRCKDSTVAQKRYVWAEPAPSTPTVCIEVDSPDHTYLAGRSLLPTHNSVRVAKDFPIWALLQNPDLRIVVASYAQRLADRNGRTIRNTITAHPDLGLRVARDNGSVSEWTLDGHEGGVYSVGIGGALTGQPSDLLIIDDPIKDRREADSKVFRDNNWDWWTDTASARLAPGAPTILILTRWHHDDLAGRLLKSDTGWNLLNIPAQCEDPTTDPLGRNVGEYMASARKRTPAQWEQRKKAAGPATWASLYQGNPTPTVGNIFPRTAWKTWTTLPPLRDATIIQSWDMAFKATTTSDYVVGQVWAKVWADYYLLDQVRGRFDFPETLTQFRALTAKWPQAVAKLVEDKANGPAVIAALRHEIPGIIPIEPEGGKVARAHAAQPFAIAGNIHLPDEPWVADFIEEAAAFPNGANDDMVDAFTQAVNTLNLYATPFDDVRDHVPDNDPHAYLGGY